MFAEPANGSINVSGILKKGTKIYEDLWLNCKFKKIKLNKK